MQELVRSVPEHHLISGGTCTLGTWLQNSREDSSPSGDNPL